MRYNYFQIYENGRGVTKDEIDPKQGDTFPYFRYIMKKDSIKQRLENLSGYKFKAAKISYRINNIPGIKDLSFMGGPPTLILYSPEDYLKYNKISDYYQDYARSRARRYDNQYSSHELWEIKWGEIYEKLAKRKKTINACDLREAIYFAQQEVGSFRCTTLAGIIEMFGAKNVLDFSAGWGDRLAAAAAKRVKYTGVDPNTAVHVVYKEFIEDFCGGLDIEMICSGFENPAIDDKLRSRGPYDLVFTSPPYFNLEIYTDEKTQSADENTDLDRWFEDFLLVALEKSMRLLGVGGIMAININDMREGPYFVEKMVATVNTWRGVKYLGVLSYAEVRGGVTPRSGQPIWIWRKTEEWNI